MILVFGKSGQLAKVLAGDPEVLCIGREEADLMVPGSAAHAIAHHAPQGVINAAAYTAVDQAEIEPNKAKRLNSDAPGEIALACAKAGIPMVHVSTDYVFDGTGTAAWKPHDPVAPLNVYGRTKADGEAAVMAAGGVAAILRTAWVFSDTGQSFVTAILRLARTRQNLDVVADQTGGPIHAHDLAQGCLRALRTLISEPNKAGIHHFAGTPEISRAEFAREIVAAAGMHCSVRDIPTSDFPTPAQRPLNSRLDCSSFVDAFGMERPDWRAGLARAVATWKQQEVPT